MAWASLRTTAVVVALRAQDDACPTAAGGGQGAAWAATGVWRLADLRPTRHVTQASSIRKLCSALVKTLYTFRHPTHSLGGPGQATRRQDGRAARAAQQLGHQDLTGENLPPARALPPAAALLTRYHNNNYVHDSSHTPARTHTHTGAGPSHTTATTTPTSARSLLAHHRHNHTHFPARRQDAHTWYSCSRKMHYNPCTCSCFGFRKPLAPKSPLSCPSNSGRGVGPGLGLDWLETWRSRRRQKETKISHEGAAVMHDAY